MTLTTTPSASVTEALNTRITVRQFLPQPVPEDKLKKIFSMAQRSPSGGNLQPWNTHVMTGKALDDFREKVMAKVMSGDTETETFPAYPPNLWEPHRTWRYKLGEDMYALLGIGRDNKPGRLMQVAKNFTFFVAPVGIIITTDKRMQAPQHMDIGIYLQSVMLLAREEGLHTAPQGAWRNYPETAREFLKLPDDQHVLVGMSMGYGDPEAPVNDLYADRATMDDLVTFHT